MDERQKRQLRNALRLPEAELLIEIGRLLDGGLGAAPPPEGFGTKALKWLRVREPHIRDTVCRNVLIRRLSSGNEEVLAENVSAVLIQLFTGETSSAVAIYVAAYLAKRGIQAYCREEWLEDGRA